jgi:hypothetical protein
MCKKKNIETKAKKRSKGAVGYRELKWQLVFNPAKTKPRRNLKRIAAGLMIVIITKLQMQFYDGLHGCCQQRCSR